MDRREYILQSIKNRSAEIMPMNAKVILFEGSDWDILILLDKQKLSPSDFDEFAYPLFELGWMIDAEIHPMLYTFSDWERRNMLPLYKDVLKEGIELCC